MRVVFVTCPPAGGAPLLRQLVAERLVAGGNILPGVRSIYRWKGEICEEAEEVLLMETAADRMPALLARIPALHPYEAPKIISFAPEEGLPAYLAWVAMETRGMSG